MKKQPVRGRLFHLNGIFKDPKTEWHVFSIRVSMSIRKLPIRFFLSNLSKAALDIPLAMFGRKLYDLYKKSQEKHKVQEVDKQWKTASHHYFQRMSSGNSNVVKPNQF